MKYTDLTKTKEKITQMTDPVRKKIHELADPARKKLTELKQSASVAQLSAAAENLMKKKSGETPDSFETVEVPAAVDVEEVVQE